MRTEPYLVIAAQAANKAGKAPGYIRSDEAIAYYPPDKDPFYNVADKAMYGDTGVIISSRSVHLPKYNNVKSAYQVAYTTRDSAGGAAVAITTVIVPSNIDGANVVSYQIPENAAWINCAPSWELLQGDKTFQDVQSLLDKGWVVNAPDHEGLDSVFGSTVVGGQATLDSLRAVENLANLTGIHHPDFALWGYSGGSIATGWAAEIHEEYAPELHIKGVAIGGYIVDLVDTSKSVNKGPWAGLIPTFFVALAKVYEAMELRTKEQLKEGKAPELQKVLTQCAKENLAQFSGQDIFDLFTPGDEIFKNGGIDWVLSQNKLGKHAPKAPLLVYQGLKDEVVPFEGVDRMVDFYCSNGASVRYVKGANYDHAQMETGYSANAIQWIADMFANKASSSCIYENITRDDTDPDKPTTPDPQPKPPVNPEPVTPDPNEPVTPDPVTPDPVTPVPNEPITPDHKPPTTPDPVTPDSNKPTTPDPVTPNPRPPTIPEQNTPNPNTPPNPNTIGPVSTPGSISTPTSTRTTNTPISTVSAVTTAPSLANLATTEAASFLFATVLALLALLF